MYETPEHHPAFEEYCEAIFELQEDDVEVIQARIAERLNVSRPAVSEMVKRLRAEGLIKDSGPVLRLTGEGVQLASSVVRRHRIAERFMTDVLKLSWTTAHQEAGKWEHVLSDEVEAAMIELLDDPTTCPHGNPIPGAAYDEPAAVSLSTVGVGTTFEVLRIPEELEVVEGLLDHLESAGLFPGRSGAVEAVSPDGTVTVRVDDRVTGIGAHTAERLQVVDPVGS